MSSQAQFVKSTHAGDSIVNPIQWDKKKEHSKDIIIANFEALGLDGAVFTAGKSGKIPYGQIKKYLNTGGSLINPGGGGRSSTPGKISENLQFYYHPDHLGSSNYITNASGEVYQHEEYFPFGETFVEERNSAEYTTYLFNGKELDEETGLYYYGARYYDPRISNWLGVDLLAEKYAGWSPYNYTADNPLKFIDPDGKVIVFVVREKNGTISNQLTYSNGSFRLQNGKVYDPNKGSISKGLDRTIAAYNKILSSGDKVLINQLKSLETSKNYHFIEEGSGSVVKPYDWESAKRAEKNVKNGIPVGASTILDFSKEAYDELKTTEGIDESDLSLITHEMQNQYDFDQGKNADDEEINSAKDPSEIRAVNNEIVLEKKRVYRKEQHMVVKKLTLKSLIDMKTNLVIQVFIILVLLSCGKRSESIDESFILTVSREDKHSPSQFSNVAFFCKGSNDSILLLDIYQLREIHLNEFSKISYYEFLTNVLNQKTVIGSNQYQRFKIDKIVESFFEKVKVNEFRDLYCVKKGDNRFYLKREVPENERNTILYFLFINNYLTRIDDYSGAFIIKKNN